MTATAQRELVLALLLVLCYGFFRQVPSWNEYSRYDLVLAIVDDRTLSIDPYHRNTGDKALYDGHYYSTKAPGSAVLGAPVYALMRAAGALAGGDRPAPELVMHMLAFTIAGLPTVVLALLLLRFLRELVGEPWALAVAAGYGLATIAFPFATMYFGHAASTCFLFAAFYILWRARSDHRSGRPLVAGFLAGWAALVEIPVALGGVVLLAYALWLGRRHALLYLVGGLPPAAIMLGYNWLAFDHPFRVGYQYSVNFEDVNGRGLVGVIWPSVSTLADLMFSPRGLLRLSPWLALAPLGLWAWWRREHRAEPMVCAAIVVAFLAYNSGAVNPFGGFTPGPRYLLPSLPFTAVLVALSPSILRPVVALLIVVSGVLTLTPVATLPSAPSRKADPLLELWLPRLLAHDLADTTAWLHWGWHGLQPLFWLALAAVAAVATLQATTRETRAARWLARAGLGLLVALVVGFGTPLDPSGLLGPGARAAGSQIDVAVVDAGIAVATGRDQRSVLMPWVQLENRSGNGGETTVQFSIYGPSGEQVWTERQGPKSWRGGERKRLDDEWSPRQAAPGEYRLAVEVMSAGRGVRGNDRTVLAAVQDAARVTIRP